jgi:NADH-quinone oxidoreductase subunit J
MLELIIILVMGLAIASAAAMLLTSNAVHSALFLIVTMMCIAFLFLTLNAPFLAMIQITVYAGAIMVLFLFVIMLLGSEKLDAETTEARADRRYRWFLPLAGGLGIAFVVMLGGVMLGVIGGSPLDRPVPGQAPLLRVINAAPDAGSFEVHTAAGVLVEPLAFRGVSDFMEVPAGETTLMVHFADDSMQQITAPLTVNTAFSLIVYGMGAQPQLTVITDDLTTVTEDDASRVAVFNAYGDPISVVDFRSEFDDNDTVVLIPELASGQISETFYMAEGPLDWTFVSAANQADRLFRMNEYEFETDNSELILFLGEPTVSGAQAIVSPVALPIRSEARPEFGGPRAIGYMLFTDFLLPFQLLGLLLLAAMVGAIVLTHRELDRAKGRGIGQRRVVSRPLVNVIAAQVGHEVVTPTDEAAQLPETMGE